MNRKNYLFTAAVLLALSSGTPFLTSCQKDYDGQLEMIRNQIKNGDINLDGLEKKVALMEAQIKVLNEALAQADQENKEAIKKLIADLEAAKAELNGRIDALQKVIDGNSQEIQDLKAQIEAVSQEFNQKLLEISTRIDKIDASLNRLDGRMQKLEEQMTAMEEKQVAVEKSIEEVKKEIAGLGSDMEAQKAKLEGALKQLQALDSKLTQEIGKMQQMVDEVKKATEENAANLEALRQAAIDAITELKKEVDAKINDLANEMAGLSEAVTSLGISVNELNRKYDNLSNQLNQIQETYNQQIQEIWKKINSMTPGDGEDLTELRELVTELQNNLNELRQEVDAKFKEMMETQAVFGQDLQEVQGIVEAHRKKLNDLEKKLDDLGVKVSNLEETVAEMRNAYRDALTKINERLEALEKESGGNPDLEQMKRELQDLKEEVNNQAQAILDIQNNQDKQAKKLVELDKYVKNSVIAMQLNYSLLDSRVTIMDEFMQDLNESLKNTNDVVADLMNKVNQHSADIAALQKRIEELETGQQGYVTREEVEAMLGDYYDKATVDAKFEEVFRQLDNCPTRDDVQKVVDKAVGELQDQLDEMQNSIKELAEDYSKLNEKVDMLMNRIQSFELVADYNDGTVKVNRTDNGRFQMNLLVEITPEDAVDGLMDLKGIISMRCKEVIPVRSSAGNLPEMKVTAISKEKGMLKVTAEFDMADAPNESKALPYQVAVVLNDGNNYKLTEYRGLRLDTGDNVDEQIDYKFETADGEVLKTKDDMGVNLFTEADIYKGDFLKDIENQYDKVCQIDGSQVLFDTRVTASSTVEGSLSQGLAVNYFLAAIYNTRNKPEMNLVNFIGVTPDGNIYMKTNLAPNLTTSSLEGYKVIVGIQAVHQGHNYGKTGYVCFRLQKKQ